MTRVVSGRYLTGTWRHLVKEMHFFGPSVMSTPAYNLSSSDTHSAVGAYLLQDMNRYCHLLGSLFTYNHALLPKIEDVLQGHQTAK